MIDECAERDRAKDELLRRQQGLAERIASAFVSREHHPALWQVYFNSALREIQQFDAEFRAVNK